MEIICSIHGSFWQNPNNHTVKQYGCPKCKGENNAKRCRSTVEDFTLKAISIHKDKYDYSKVNYINNHTLITIICPIHGEFSQMPNNHLQGEGCYKCGRAITENAKLLSVDEIINRANKIHNYTYDYSLITKSYRHFDKIPIICPKHGEFLQILHNHLAGEGCPICRESKGERIVRAILNNKGIKYEE